MEISNVNQILHTCVAGGKKAASQQSKPVTGIRISYQLDVEESFVRIYRFPPVRMEIKNVLLISVDSRERFEKGIVYPF